jgi:hypothetical protein
LNEKLYPDKSKNLYISINTPKIVKTF